MSLRTRRGLAVWASILLAVAACSSSTPTAAPTVAPPTAAPPTAAPPTAAPPTAAPPTAAPPTAAPATASAAAPSAAAPSASAAAPSASAAAPSASAAAPSASAAAPSGSAVAPSASTGGSTAPADVYNALFGSTYAPAQGTTGGNLVFGEWQPVSNLNPYFTTAFTDFEGIDPALEGLVNIDAQGKFFPDMLSEIPTPKNGDIVIDTPKGGFTMTLKFKPGLMWSDGTPLTAMDFKNTYDWAAKVGAANVGCAGCATFVPQIDPGAKDPWAPDNLYIKSIDVSSDNLTATVTWQKAYAGWLGWLGNPPLPPAVLALPADQNLVGYLAAGSGNAEKIPWSGPFTVTGFTSDGITYARNDDYKAGPHTAYLDTLTMKFYGDKSGMISDFLSGNLDLAFDMTQADFASIQGVDPSVGKATLDSAWQYEHFDLNNSPTANSGHSKAAAAALSDPAVRAAIAAAVNKQGLIDVLFPGAGVAPACSPAPPGTWWRVDVNCPKYDPTAAGTALDNAGWKVDPNSGARAKDLNGNGTIDPDEILRLHLCTTSGNPTRLTELSSLSADLSAISIPSDVETADASSVVFAGWGSVTPTTSCSIYRGTYDIADFAYILGGDLYSNYYFTYDSSQWPEKDGHNGSNDTRFSSPQMDDALKTLSNSVDPNDQYQAAIAVQQAYAAGIPEIPTYYRAETTGVGAHVGNWPGYNPSSAGPTWNTADWFHQ